MGLWDCYTTTIPCPRKPSFNLFSPFKRPDLGNLGVYPERVGSDAASEWDGRNCGGHWQPQKGVIALKGRGYIQVYTGNGKGKTTAAIGLAIRALGAAKKVFFLQFMKSKVYSEQQIMARLSPNLTLETVGKPFFIVKEGSMPETELNTWRKKAVVFPPGQPPREYVELIAQGMERAEEALTSGDYDLVILDELIVALHFELVTWPQVAALIDSKAPNVELVLTGRGAVPELIEKADLVTEMREIKHYYHTQGVAARKGFDS